MTVNALNAQKPNSVTQDNILSTLLQDSSPPQSSDYSFENRLRIIAFGDSLTQRASQPDGWLTLLQNYYQRKCDTFNRGYSGYSTEMAKYLLRTHIDKKLWPSDTSSHQIILLFFGANDAALRDAPQPAKRQSVTIEKFESNLREIINLIQRSCKAHLVLISPPAVDGQAWAKWQFENGKIESLQITRDNRNTKLYADVVEKLAKEMAIPFVDLFWEMMSDRKNLVQNPEFFSDGLHFSSLGQLHVFKLIKDAIEKISVDSNLKCLDASTAKMDGPNWDTLSSETLAKTFS